ncbi:hypothetical protein H5410_010022 [Solanum commersonii]|uniref:F-box associated domain-containing protein n=1 Tax=Solanum commersonii TaxID=4109 RepID=A0A9J6AKE8_SOLCO|nr:hypothetical protein H5410_010022 [Solanum commersonii]
MILPSHVEIPPQEEYVYGLGYDATSDEYKILRIGMHDEIPDEILALKSGSWRKIEETSDEMSGEIPLPGILVGVYVLGLIVMGVSVLGGKLCLYHKHEDFDIWVLNDYGVKESWTKWFTIPSNEVARDCVIIPIYRFSDDEVLLSYFCWKGMVYRTYNVLLNSIWPLHCDHIYGRSIQDGLVYKESLIFSRSPNIM